MNATFELTKEKREDMVGLIQLYHEKEVGEPIGNLAAMLLLDFFMDKLAPLFYNLGVEDSHAYMMTKMEDIFEIQK